MAKIAKYFYVVLIGHTPGIYNTIEKCKEQVNNFPFAYYRKCLTSEKANEFFNNYQLKTKRKNEIPYIAENKPPPKISNPPVLIQKHGCCKDNERDCFSGIGINYADGSKQITEPLPGVLQTNNRAELYAVIRAIETCENQDKVIEIKTNSRYVVNACEDLFEKLDFLVTKKIGKVYFTHIFGHNREIENKIADKLAKKGFREINEYSIQGSSSDSSSETKFVAFSFKEISSSESENKKEEQQRLKKKTTAYNNFVKEEFPNFKEEFDNSNEIMKMIGDKWKTRARTEANKTYYFDTLWKRIFFHRFFQKKSNFSNFELRDISVHLKIATYHNKQRDYMINISVKQGNQVITPLQSPLTIRAYIIEICDIDLAKKTSVNITDLLVDYNLQNMQFKKNITVHLQNEITIDCSTCQFTEDEIALYYIDWMYQFKKQDSKNNNSIILALGDNFNVAKGDSEIPSFLSDGYLEAAYMPDMKHGPTFNAEKEMMQKKELIFPNTFENVIFTIIQKVNTKQNNIELHDIAIQLKFTLVHNEDIQKRTQIPVHGNESIYITPLVEAIKLKFFIVEICDKAIAMEAEPSISDIILNGDIQDIQFREYIEPHLETE
ncbi:hypothetical protein C2G38_2187873 [Gigaspora rosea]|uniref:ribonuclease H n=1 Tax=Gigaspora rosea TaxID=44941 RepID=A0A397V5C6_9GLOM|nr:hypothetical protein C2G38_2187873 [Gigaspora rosea]